jgi:diguanylate cyclase (GGDEF)-like protein
VLLGGYVLFYLSWHAFHWIPGNTLQVGELFFIPIDAAAVFTCWRASRRCSVVPPLRWFWLLVALAIAGQLAGDATIAAYGVADAEVPYPSLADLFYLSTYPLLLAALWRVPVAPSTRAQRIKLGLDIATVLGAGVMVIWYFVLKQVVSEGGPSALQVVTSTAYPMGDIILVAGLGIVLLRWSPPVLRLSLSLITIGLAMFIVADVGYAYLSFHVGYSAGGLIDTLYVGALALFSLAGASQKTVDLGAAESAVPTREQSERRVGLLPFAALAVGSLVLITAMWGEDFVSQVSIVLFAIGLASLIAFRQYLTQKDMIRLQRELREAQVELSLLADQDVLTKAANRRVIGQVLDNEVERAFRYGRELSLLFLDIDHFKEINDTLGHANGDRVLADFASVLKTVLRPNDTLGRWGGEEFLVILPETGGAEAGRAAERAREQVENHNFMLTDQSRLTCSIGVASYPAEATDPAMLIDLADRAMYEAKRLGRNRVVSGALQWWSRET